MSYSFRLPNQNHIERFAVLYFTISMVICSCSKKNYTEQSLSDFDQFESSRPDVYMAGCISGGNHLKATYWKNGKIKKLTNGNYDAEGLSIVVSEAGVFVAGYENNGAFNVAKFWRNGKAEQLSAGNNPSTAYGIALYDNNVYVAGYESNGLHDVAKYWKNGSEVVLTDGSHDARAYAITIVGLDVYVAGEEFNGAHYVAKFWKNGVASALTDGTADGHAYSITVNADILSHNDIYVAGCEISKSTGKMVAEYWDNGISNRLSVDTINARANSITISEGMVYIAGTKYQPGDTPVATYWLFNTEIGLTGSLSYSTANAIAVQGHNIYLAGQELKGDFKKDHPVAGYWKNGNEILLQDSSNSRGWTNAIAFADNTKTEKKKYKKSIQDSYSEEQTSDKIGNTILSIFHFLKDSPAPNSGVHNQSQSKTPSYRNAGQSKQSLSKSNPKKPG